MAERKQDLVSNFCQDPKHLDYLVYIKNIDSFALYQEERGYYKIFSEKEFMKYVYHYMYKTVQREISTSLVSDIISLAKLVVYREVESEMSDYIAFNDKLLNLKTFELEDFHHQKNVIYNIDCESHAAVDQKPCERFMLFLDEVMVDQDGVPDKELQTVLQEMFGYYLLNTLEGHQMFFLVGEGRNGKSVVLNLLENIIGQSFIAHKTLEDLTTKEFAPADLIGKKLNVCNEDESKFVKSDKFKALVGGDYVGVRRLYQAGFSMKPTTKFVFSTNEPPTFSGYTVALLDRINIIMFNRYFKPEERDTKILDKLLAEKSGIVGWAIEGAKRIVANGFKFTRSNQMDSAKKEFEKSISSAIQFVSENYTEDPAGKIEDDSLYADYHNWCMARNKKPLQSDNFFKDLKRWLQIKPKSTSVYSSEKGKTVTARFLIPKN